MRIVPVLVAMFALTALAKSQEPAPRTADGTVVAQTSCQFAGYEETSAFTKRYYSREEYSAVSKSTAVDCLRIRYLSDGLSVVGFIVKPRSASGMKYPVIVYNRGGFRDIGKLDTWNLVDFYGLASQGFVVLASQYRGNDGGEGRDEVGGADVADVMALQALMRQLPYADPANVFLYGLSRGGMESLLALRKGFPAKAAAVVGAVFDLEAFGRRSPQVLSSATRSIPEYARDGAAILRNRSAMNWPEQISVPLLIIHGADDEEVPATEAMAFATKLAQLKKRYQLMVYANDIHEVAINRLDRDARIVAWFREIASSKP